MNMDFKSAKELLDLCEENQLPISEVMRQRECILGEVPRDAVDHRMAKAWEIMRASATQPLKKPIKSMGGLIGGEAKKLETHYNKKKNICGDVLQKAMTYAMAVLEVNASMGLIVAAPTAGSAGVVPGMMLALQECYRISDQRIVDALFNAGAVGYLAMRNATVAGAVGGCQAEVGIASAMAASAAVELMGGDPQQCLDAASTVLMNMLGLVCDPVGGLVEYPCQNRNAAGVANALIAAELSLSGIRQLIPFDQMLEAMYAKELDKETLAKIAELKKTDPKAAAELSRERSYHIDHGYGMDCYAVGPTLGAGVAALMVNDTIIYPWCYKNQEILDNGPLRFTVKLEFTPLTVKGDSTVVETRLITLDAGSHLNKTVVSYSNLKETLPIVAGIVLHEPDGAVVADAANGYITYVDPTTGPDNGKIFMGAAVPAVVKDAKTVLFSEKEKKERNNADGHVLAVSDYEPGSEYVYYWGFAWDKADIKTADAWNRYMADFAQKVRNPLTVKVN